MFREVTSTQRVNGYKGYIHVDDRDLVRKELKYAPTPALLLVGRDNAVADASVFYYKGEHLGLDKFIARCVDAVGTSSDN